MTRPPEALITDPQALLAAMAASERALCEAARPPRASVEPRPTPRLVEPPSPAPTPEPPVLREDERFGRLSDSGVVVIIRRRRAA